MTGRMFVATEQLRRAHAGLHLDKFMDREGPDWNSLKQKRLDDGAYRLAYQRWERRWREDSPGRVVLKGRVVGRLVTGLGAESVLEVSLRLSHTYGTPVIPGSAIKGVLRRRMEDSGTANFLFGGPDNLGYVAFQDAWWIPESRPALALDVMTVHHPGYYTGPHPSPPSDLDSPNPVQFLSVRGAFLFVAEFYGDDASGRWKAYVETLLRDTLEKDGIGGKRGAGYGRFDFGR